MANTNYQSVVEYIAAQPRERQAVLRKVRATIRKALPRTDEVISYQIPAYKMDGAAVIYFAGWKEHFSLYPIGELVAQTLKRELAAYDLKKGTIRFPLQDGVPVALITRIAKLRAKETTVRLKARARKAAKAKKK